jgi:hypothetical protein
MSTKLRSTFLTLLVAFSAVGGGLLVGEPAGGASHTAPASSLGPALDVLGSAGEALEQAESNLMEATRFEHDAAEAESHRRQLRARAALSMPYIGFARIGGRNQES